MLHSRRRTLATQKMLGHGEAEFFAPGRAPCVVAFHGFGGTVAELRPVLDAIAEAGYAVDACLLPGHGTGAQDLQDVVYEDWLGAARRRMQAGVATHGRVALLGFSLGSLLALEIASERPEGLAGLIALGTALTLRPLSSIPLGLAARLPWRMPDVYLLKPRAGDLVDSAGMSGLVTYDSHPMRSAVEVYRAGARVRSVVGRIACPALVLHGRRDHVCSWSNATWLASHIGTADVSVRLFEQSAHVLACDGERVEVAREVLRFVKRLA
jgi:carboxylesterase